jgi:hypothetical protein
MILIASIVTLAEGELFNIPSGRRVTETVLTLFNSPPATSTVEFGATGSLTQKIAGLAAANVGKKDSAISTVINTMLLTYIKQFMMF